MIDLIKCCKSKLTTNEIAALIVTNKLSNNYVAGKPCYSNKITKNLKAGNGIYININTSGTLKVEGSLHKYYNDVSTHDRQNYNLFTMNQAKESINKLITNKSIPPSGLKVKYFEIGINLEVPQDCITYLKKMKYITLKSGTRKRFYINPKFKNERTITTEFYNEIRTNYKAYDKGQEVQTKRGTKLSSHLLRIETVRKRVENQSLHTFCSKANLKRLHEHFFRDWESVEFEPEILCPPGTRTATKDLIKKILLDGLDTTMAQTKEDRHKRLLTDKEYRRIREFIQFEWESFKDKIAIIPSPAETEFRKELERIKIILYKNIQSMQ